MILYWWETRREVGAVMVQILARFDWRVVGMLFHNHGINNITRALHENC